MITMYRGVRLKDPSRLNIEGMRYYWNSAQEVIDDINKSIRAFGRSVEEQPYIKNYFAEARRQHRVQIWGTQRLETAMSYAVHSPEIIILPLEWLNIDLVSIQEYLNETYGYPHVVEFLVDLPPMREGFVRINEPVGTFVPPENILRVGPVRGYSPGLAKRCL
jgi:hypothetical protein